MGYTKNGFRNSVRKRQPNIELLDDYVDNTITIVAICTICGYKFGYKPRTILEKGCPHCNNSRIHKRTHEEYLNDLMIVNNGTIIPLENYIDSNTNILHHCNNHNYDFYAKPSKMLIGQGCKYCGKEKRGLANRTSHEDFVWQLYNKVGNEFEIIDNYFKSDVKVLFRHNLSDGTSHTFMATPNSLLSGQGCGACAGKQVSIGYNDINTTNPSLYKFLYNKEDGYKYTQFSSSVIKWKCPDCGYEFDQKISEISSRGFSCKHCSDGISYPNKLIYNILLQIKDSLDFLQREFTPDWCKFVIDGKTRNGRYDVYFGYKNNKYIIEMDGGLGHGNKSISNIDNATALLIDSEKDRLAVHNNIIPIRINSNYDNHHRYEFMVDSIKSSKLNEIIDFNIINFNKADLDSQSSVFVKCCNLWNQGLSPQQIINEIGVVGSTVTSYLKRGRKLGLCNNYSKEESAYRAHSNDIICITTNKIFRSIVDASNYYDIFASDISKCCRHKSSFGGWYNDLKLVWMYYDEYIKLSEEEVLNYVSKENEVFTKVICLNNKKVFTMVKLASEWCNQKSSTGIVNCCTGRYKTSGIHPKTGEKLVWQYYDDYLKQNNDVESNCENAVAFSI